MIIIYWHSGILWEGLGQSYKLQKMGDGKQTIVERERN